MSWTLIAYVPKDVSQEQVDRTAQELSTTLRVDMSSWQDGSPAVTTAEGDLVVMLNGERRTGAEARDFAPKKVASAEGLVAYVLELNPQSDDTLADFALAAVALAGQGCVYVPSDGKVKPKAWFTSVKSDLKKRSAKDEPAAQKKAARSSPKESPERRKQRQKVQRLANGHDTQLAVFAQTRLQELVAARDVDGIASFLQVLPTSKLWSDWFQCDRDWSETDWLELALDPCFRTKDNVLADQILETQEPQKREQHFLRAVTLHGAAAPSYVEFLGGCAKLGLTPELIARARERATDSRILPVLAQLGG